MTKVIKYLLITIAFILLLVFVMSTYIKSQALEKLTDVEGISCKNLDINLFTGCLELESLGITRPLGDTKTEKVKLFTNTAYLHGLSYWQYWKNNRINFDNLIIGDLVIEISPNDTMNVKVDTTQQAGESTIEEISIDHIDLQKGKFALKNADFKAINLDSFVAKIEKFQFFTKRDSQQIVWKKVAFSGQQFLLDGQKSDNQLLVDKIALTNEKTMKLQDFRWKPKYSKTNYLNPYQYTKARIDAHIPSIELRQFPLDDLIFQQQFKAQSITTQNGILKIYSDRNKPQCTDCPKNYHYEGLIASELRLDIDSISIKNSTIFLEELGEGKTKAGHLDWSKVYASIYNLTNNQTKSKSHPNTVADIQAVFVDEGNVELHFEFPNFNKNGDYTFHGGLDKVDLKEINTFLVFSKQFRIKQGKVTSFAFEGSGNSQSASGDMELRYKNLELELLKRDRSSRTFLSKVVNVLIGKENNPDEEKGIRKGKMYFERDKNKSFIGNWWRTLQTGIQSTMLPNILLPDELDVKTN